MFSISFHEGERVLKKTVCSPKEANRFYPYDYGKYFLKITVQNQQEQFLLRRHLSEELQNRKVHSMG